MSCTGPIEGVVSSCFEHAGGTHNDTPFPSVTLDASGGTCTSTATPKSYISTDSRSVSSVPTDAPNACAAFTLHRQRESLVREVHHSGAGDLDGACAPHSRDLHVEGNPRGLRVCGTRRCREQPSRRGGRLRRALRRARDGRRRFGVGELL